MQKSIKKAILFFFVQVLVHIWDIGANTLAHLRLCTPLRPQFELSFAEGPSSLLSKNKGAAVLDHDHLQVYNPISIKESLQHYLEQPPKQRKKLYPFFEMSQDHTTYTNLINQMLHTEREAWGEKIKDLLELESANEKIAVWNFLLELINHMPTPAVQVTLMAALKEQEKMFLKEGLVNEDMQKLLDAVKLACVHEIKNHVTSLKGKIKSDKFENIFTKEKQEKLGMYKMKLEREWLSAQEDDLFEYWASHMDVYLGVKGPFKDKIESQVVLMNLIQARQSSSEKIKLVPEFEQWIASQIGKLTNGLISFINTLDDEQIVKFAGVQLKLRDGFAILGIWNPEQKKKLLAFWSNNIPFYLEIKDTEAKETWLASFENLILQDPNHMETVIQDFLKVPTPEDSQECPLDRFFKFHQQVTRAQTVKKMSERGLAHGTTF